MDTNMLEEDIKITIRELTNRLSHMDQSDEIIIQNTSPGVLTIRFLVKDSDHESQ